MAPELTQNPDTPAAEPPPGVQSNFIDPPSRKNEIIIVEAVFIPLMLIAVLIRIYVRRYISKLWGAEDITCVLAACGSISNMIMFIEIFPLGLGRHMWDIPMSVFQNPVNNRLLVVNITYPWTVCFTKLSILLLFNRLFTLGRVRFLIWAGIIMNIACYTAIMVLSVINIAICIDLLPRETPFCSFERRYVSIWTSSINVFTDFYIFFLPIHCLLKLRISSRRKLGLFITFASGLGACAVSVARLNGILKIRNSIDVTWDSAELTIFSHIEINVGIIVACVFTFPVFIRRLRESRAFHSTSQSVCLWALLSNNQKSAIQEPEQD